MTIFCLRDKRVLFHVSRVEEVNGLSIGGMDKFFYICSEAKSLS